MDFRDPVFCGQRDPFAAESIRAQRIKRVLFSGGEFEFQIQFPRPEKDRGFAEVFAFEEDLALHFDDDTMAILVRQRNDGRAD